MDSNVSPIERLIAALLCGGRVRVGVWAQQGRLGWRISLSEDQLLLVRRN